MRLALLALLVAFGSTAVAKDPPTIAWKKTVLDKKFRSEGCAILDVNKDGKMDVAVGEVWYEAPDWKMHEMQKPGNYGDGLGGYSKVFACWAEDLNADGFQDLIVVGFPGEPAYWLENPKGKGTTEDGKPMHWAKHEIWHSACNETPLYQDLLGDGKKVLVMGYQPKGAKPEGNEGKMAYFTPNPKDANAVWIAHPISDPAMKGAAAGTNRFSHGLGLGDLNGDKKLDVITGGGWYEQLAVGDDKTHPWAFHKAEFTDNYSDMFAFDADFDGHADVLCTSAHKHGIWWYKQRPGKDGKKGARIVVLQGTSTLLGINWSAGDLRGNALLVEGSFSWLASHERFLDIPDKPLKATGVRLTEDALRTIFVCVIILIPLVVAVLEVVERETDVQTSDNADRAGLSDGDADELGAFWFSVAAGEIGVSE